MKKGETMSQNKILQVELLTTPTKLFLGTTGTPSRSDSARALTGLTQEGEPIIKSELCNSCNTSCHWQMMIASILLLSCLFNSLSFSGLICRSLTTVQLERTPHTPRFDSSPFFLRFFNFFRRFVLESWTTSMPTESNGTMLPGESSLHLKPFYVFGSYQL